MITPSIATLLRVKRRPTAQVSSARFRKLQRAFTQRESLNWLLVELVAFFLLAALSVWPMLHMVQALRAL